MKKFLNKKGGVATVIITIGLVLVVLLSFPFLRALQNDNRTVAQNTGNAFLDYGNSAVKDSKGVGYSGSTSDWTTK